MRTIKRNVNEVNTSLSSYTKLVKYHNQLEWKGIVENKNIFTTDQLSQADAKNVYVDDHGSLVSRPVLLREPLNKEILPTNSELVDSITYGKIKIYVSNEYLNSENHYKVVVVANDTSATLSDLTKYHISTIDNYIICFNNIGAKVFDINNQSKGWQDLSNFVEVPVIKRVVGNEITTYPTNQFTSKYKEEYIWSNNSNPDLPKGERGTVKVNSNVSNETWTLDQVSTLTDYRVLKKINYNITDMDSAGRTDNFISMAQGIICIGTGEYVDISFNQGDSFSRFWYPNHGKFLRIASISDDGQYYFFVASDAVYRLNIGEGEWTAIYVHNESDKQIGENWTTVDAGYYGSINKDQALWHFATGDMFVFMLYTSPSENCRAELPVLWFLGPYITGYDSIPVDKWNTTTPPSGANDNYGAPTMKEYQKIDVKYRGTLSCSVALCRQPFDSASTTKQETVGNPFEVVDPNLNSSYSTRVQSPTFLKIFLDKGYVREGMTFSAEPSSTTSPTLGTPVSKSYASIMCGLAGSLANSHGTIVNGTFCYILPGYFCGEYVYNNNSFTEALDIKPFWNNRYYFSNEGTTISNLPAIAGYIGINNLKKWGSEDDSWYKPNLVTVLKGPNSNNYFSEARFESISCIGSADNGNGSVYIIRGKIYKGRYNTLDLSDDGYYDFTWTLGRPINKAQSDILIEGALTNEITLDNQFVRIIYQGHNDNYYEVTTERNNTPIQLNGSVAISNEVLYYYEGDTRTAQYITVDNWSKIGPNPWRAYNATKIIPDGSYYLVILADGKMYTNRLNDNETASIIFTYDTNVKYTRVPDVSYSNTEMYLGFDNKLSITMNTRDDGGNILLSLPDINDQKFIENITNIINISTTEVALFFEDNIIICSKVQDETLGYRYDYYPTKLSTGTRLGDSVINTIEGTYTIFPTKRGLAFMNYQAFMATTDQVLTYITDNIESRYDKFYAESDMIKIVQRRDKLYITNGTNGIYIYDLARGAWWYWELPNLQNNARFEIKKLTTDQIDLFVIGRRLFKFGDQIREYKDFEALNSDDWGEDSYSTPLPQKIEWFIMSQPLHMNAPNYYKNLKQLVFQLLDDNQDNKQHTILVQIQCYRKKLDIKVPELIAFKIDELRTFVKRFNYWKINEIQYALGSDNETLIPTRLRLNGVSIKYELGEEVR